MYNAQELNAELARQNMTKGELAYKSGIVCSSFFRKHRTGKWYIDEVEKIAKVLHLSNARMCQIFFA